MRNASKGNYYPCYSEPMSQGTRCRQLALYVVFESPFNMLCDTPSNYIDVYKRQVDICRDARWGRIAEGSGEDPYLGSLLAKAYVHGYQGDSMQGKDEILSCVKHFALYGASEAGKDYNTVDMSRLRMYNEYFAPYRAAVEDVYKRQNKERQIKNRKISDISRLLESLLSTII